MTRTTLLFFILASLTWPQHASFAQDHWPDLQVVPSPDFLIISLQDARHEESGEPYVSWVIEQKFGGTNPVRPESSQAGQALLAVIDNPGEGEMRIADILAQLDGVQVSEPQPEQPPVDIQLRALNDDYDAQWDLAAWYIERGIEEADGMSQPGARWMLSAAKGGHNWAQNEVGYGYMHGVYGFEKNPDEARAWLTRAAEGGNGHAAYNIARMYEGGYGLEYDDAAITHWLDQAARRGVLDAMYELAFRVGEGVGIEADLDRKRRLLSTLSLSGYDLSRFVAGGSLSWISKLAGDLDSYIAKDVGGQDVSVARLARLAESLAADLEAGSQTPTADLDGKPMIVEPGFARTLAFEFSLHAAMLANVDAQRRVAEFYRTGFGVESSAERADYWAKRADANSS